MKHKNCCGCISVEYCIAYSPVSSLILEAFASLIYIRGPSVFLLTVALFGWLLMAVLLPYPWQLILHCPVFPLIHTVTLWVQDNKRRVATTESILSFSHASPGKTRRLAWVHLTIRILSFYCNTKKALITSSASLCGWWSVTF